GVGGSGACLSLSARGSIARIPPMGSTAVSCRLDVPRRHRGCRTWPRPGPDRRSRRPLFPLLPAACRRCDESELLTAVARGEAAAADVPQPEVGVIADVLRDI